MLIKLSAVAFVMFVSFTSEAKTISGTTLLTQKQVKVDSGDKGLVVAFLSAKCPCSNSHVDELKALSEEFPKFKFVAVHSNANESKELAVEYFKKTSLPFEIIQDSNSKLADELKAQKTPHVFVFSSDDKIVYEGAVSNNKDFQKADRKFLREALTDLSRGHEVRSSHGNTLGCAISRDKNS